MLISFVFCLKFRELFKNGLEDDREVDVLEDGCFDLHKLFEGVFILREEIELSDCDWVDFIELGRDQKNGSGHELKVHFSE